MTPRRAEELQTGDILRTHMAKPTSEQKRQRNKNANELRKNKASMKEECARKGRYWVPGVVNGKLQCVVRPNLLAKHGPASGRSVSAGFREAQAWVGAQEQEHKAHAAAKRAEKNAQARVRCQQQGRFLKPGKINGKRACVVDGIGLTAARLRGEVDDEDYDAHIAIAEGQAIAIKELRARSACNGEPPVSRKACLKRAAQCRWVWGVAKKGKPNACLRGSDP